MKLYKPFKNCTSANISTPFSSVHPAVDWYDHYGTPLVAPERVYVQGINSEEYTPNDWTSMKKGNGIKMKGDSGMEYLYWHIQPICPVSIGQTVEAGAIVAYMGNSGNVLAGGVYVPIEDRTKPPYYGTHLHAEFWKDGVRIDPSEYMVLEPTYTIFDVIKCATIVFAKIAKLIK